MDLDSAADADYYQAKGFFNKKKSTGEETSEKRLRQCIDDDRTDSKFGFERINDYKERVGFLINIHPIEILDESKRLIAALDLYFLQEDGERFKATIPYFPYFYVLTKKEAIQDVMSFLAKKYAGILSNIDVVKKEDLDMPNHLIGLKQQYLQLTFPSVSELLKVRRDILAAVKKVKEKSKANTLYSEMMSNVLHVGSTGNQLASRRTADLLESILDIREYDVPYLVRVSIDLRIFVGAWYNVLSKGCSEPPMIIRRTDLIETPDLIVLAFDIECTKQPLKFPDAENDQIIMISYMIDGQGYLINNREIISEDVPDFEYTPHPEFEGNFTVFNEPDEKSVLERFFEHITDVKPHVIVTYNGDSFDWPFVEKRAAVHGFQLNLETGFFKNRDGVYFSRPIIHMDCFCWVKRDSYLPVGSQSLKAVAKAKLRYDPVELDPEEMCRLAAEEPQSLCNYSVSDAVATYYLYMKYVHPFIFALCTIIPMGPDDVLRKGSGTLCEALLMVEAFHANIVFPNKQEQELNKLTDDGHVLDSETYVGGHVEALESGVFRADLPCRFKLEPEAFDGLIKGIESVLAHAIVEEEHVPLECVTNLNEVIDQIRDKLLTLRDQPIRVERPIIYHLDVGAMYPNIILTNRLQPSAIVNEETCAVCDFNRPGATCQRRMKWLWRGEYMPATKNEFLRIQQQLETEKFPSNPPGGQPRAFHQLSKEEQAAAEKKRLSEYCRKVYKKQHVTRIEEIESTICQKENSFYVDTVRAFRDRRYEYKGLCKDAKKRVGEAIASGDAQLIKSAKNREVLYDSLQLAHKCILNSFYGYVMRKGARWHSMEMAGIVCFTGANIITKAREIIEKVGRPLELDTDGIWCVLPSSFPENFTIHTTHEKKKNITVSYPNAVLNRMVKDEFTNDVYHELIDPATLKYIQKSENTIFFEVDGPYLAMVLPASKEEGKKLKKRYAVFNFDKSLAELKGFEVKRRGELQLIKIFQSSVFEAFLLGNTLEQCYEAVAKVADYWLNVLYTKAYNLPDSELFELISENRSMSRKLEDYGDQKSTSISTAKRLAEFLGDQMVKDKGLACRYIISRKPEGAPVTERAIPLAIFQSEPSVKRHYLRKWLKDSLINDVDIRQVLDWNYYIERLNGAIQKIITIPAALQGINNPVPRVAHPDWLHKKILEKNDVLKQRKIKEFFTIKVQYKNDIEDGISTNVPFKPSSINPVAIVNKKRKRDNQDDGLYSEEQLRQNWKDVLGPAPHFGKTRAEHVTWLLFQKKKWAFQLAQRDFRDGNYDGKKSKRGRTNTGPGKGSSIGGPVRALNTMTGFLKSAQRTILRCPWQVIQFAETGDPGLFRVWALVEKELHMFKLVVPRIFLVNRRTSMKHVENENKLWRPAHRVLPRSRPVHYLYEYTVPEWLFIQKQQEIMQEITSPDIEGIYESQVPLEFRLLVTLGCVCAVDHNQAFAWAKTGMKETDHFEFKHLVRKTLSYQSYLEKLPDGTSPLKHIFLYQHHSANTQRSIYGVYIAATRKVVIFVLDTVKTSNQMPNLQNLYGTERAAKLEEGDNVDMSPEQLHFEVQVVNDPRAVYKGIQRILQTYRDEKRGPSVLVLQTALETAVLSSNMPGLTEFPQVRLHAKDSLTLFSTMEWQRAGAKAFINNILKLDFNLAVVTEQCRYFNIPIGNLPCDSMLFGTDLFYARHLIKNNHALWCSTSSLPDLGGRQSDDGRLLAEMDDATVVQNHSGAYATISVEMNVHILAVNTLLKFQHVNDIEGASSAVAFDANAKTSVEEMLGNSNAFSSYDESALCQNALRILRTTVCFWAKELVEEANKKKADKNSNPKHTPNYFAVQQIHHFYRWLRSPNALLYDPALRRVLYGFMKKLFVQLIAELKRLGTTVIFANFNKIVVGCKKHSVDDAVSYLQYITTSINNKELFHIIELEPTIYWEYLMWLDQGNYGGVVGLEVGCENNEDDDVPNIKFNWNLWRDQNEKVEKYAQAMIGLYVSEIWKKLRSGGRDDAFLTPQPIESTQQQQRQQTQSYQLGVSALENVKQFAIEYVIGPFSQELYDIVDMCNKTVPPYKIKLPSGRTRTFNPALEFIKAISKVLSLETCLSEEVARIRRNMLQLIGVGEFSPAAEWQDPCNTLILPEVICSMCNHSRDIDLYRDDCRKILSDGRPALMCSGCFTEYEHSDIENLLLDSVQRKVMGSVLQDLICVKCHNVQDCNMTLHCTCAGKFKHLISPTSIDNYLEIVEEIAEQYQLHLVLNSVQSLRQVGSFKTS